MLPHRPPLQSINSSSNNNNHSNGQQQQQHSVPPPIPPRSTTTRRPRRQRYNTLAVSDIDDDDHNVHTTATTTTRMNEYNMEDAVDIERADDDDDDDNNNNNITSRHRNHCHRTQRRPLYAALPTSTSSSSSSSSKILMDVTILDFTHKRWPIQITTDNITTTTTTTTTNQYEPTVYDLKHIGTTVHNIPILQQRLIYQGKLLNDDHVSLASLGIQKSGSIVHLFPKPRVVVVDNSNNSANSNTNETPAASTTSTNNNSNEPDNGNNQNSNEGNGGAHVPVIVMEQSEVDRRSEILVLGHADYVEAVSNVKLFSLMLLIISTIELLHLLSLYITPPQSTSSSNSYYNSNSYNGDGPNNAPRVHEDDNFFNDDQYNGTTASKNSSNVIDTITAGANAIDPIEMILDEWTPIKYVDLMISIFGIYVSILGMRASNENCIRTARYYLIGTTLTAIAWLIYNYIITYEIDVEVDAHPEKYYENSESSDYNYGSSATTNDDVIGETYSNNNNGSNAGYYNSNDSPYNQALSAMILPGMVWGLCIYRAWQFQHVLYDAELEAAERTNTMMSLDETNHHDNNNNDTSSGYNQTLGDVELSALSILRRHHHNTTTTGSNNINSDDTTTTGNDGNSDNPSPTTARMIT